MSFSRATLMAHLEALRGTLVGIAFAWVLGMLVVGLNLQGLLELLRQPIVALPGIKLITLNPMTGFWIAMQLITLGGAIVGAPLMLLWILRFVSPALKPQEQRLGAVMLLAAVALFLVGIAVGWYMILPAALQLALAVQGSLGFELMWAAQEYFSLILTLPLVTGACFCVPVLVGGLVRAGVLPYEQMKAQWQIAMIVILIIAASVTPTGDPITFLLIGAPMGVIYMLAVRLGKPRGSIARNR